MIYDNFAKERRGIIIIIITNNFAKEYLGETQHDEELRQSWQPMYQLQYSTFTGLPGLVRLQVELGQVSVRNVDCYYHLTEIINNNFSSPFLRLKYL